MKYATNSEIKALIERTYKSETYRKIMEWRFIDGLTYEEIAKKTFKDWEWTHPVSKKRKMEKLHKICNRFNHIMFKNGFEWG